MKRAMFCWAVGGVIVGLVLSTSGTLVCGQGRQMQMRDRNRTRQPQHQQPSGPPVETSGGIDAIRPGMIQMTTPTNQVWFLQIPAQAKVTVYGEAKPEALQVGAFIAFSAEVERRRSVIEEKISRLSIVTPTDLRPVGAYPSQGGSFGALQNQTAGAAKPGAAGGGGEGAATERFDIVGQYMGANKKGTASVMVPNPHFKPNLTVNISEDVAIDLELENPTAYMLAKKGDKIEVKGKQVAMNGAVVNEMKIFLAEPLAGPPSKKRARTARGKKPDDEAEPKEPETKETKEPAAKEPETKEPEAKAESKAEAKEDDGKDGKSPPKRRSSRRSKRGEETEEEKSETADKAK